MPRPSFKPTAAMRRDVAAAAGAGMSHEHIARGLGVAKGTLAKHFREELSVGACRKRMQVVAALFAAAKRGSASAAKAYLALASKAPAPVAPPSPRANPGKKEQQSDAAHVLASEGRFRPSPPPKGMLQ